MKRKIFLLLLTVTALVLYLVFANCKPGSLKSNSIASSLTEEGKPAPADPAKIIEDKKLDKNKLEILVDKSDYSLWLLIGKDTIKKYNVVFGGNPLDEKLRQGDGCTPEGTFKVRDLYPHKSWSKFIWIDYPNDDSRAKHNAAKIEGKIPADADIGGEIGIHGVPGGYDIMIDQRTNWTLGCISLKNSDVNEIYSLIKKGTKVTIRK